MKLSNRKSYMTSLPEGQAPESPKSKITQLIYFSILFIIAAYLIYIFAQKYFYFSSVGFVEVDKITISSARGGRIGTLDVTEGDRLKMGSFIASIENHQNCVAKEDFRLDKLNDDIATDKALLNSLRKQIQQLKSAKPTISTDSDLYRALELEKSILDKQIKQSNDIQPLINDVELLKHKIRIKSTRLKQLLSIKAPVIQAKECFDETINAPVDASVYSIQRRAFEVVTRSESILTLVADKAEVQIEVYLEMDRYPLLEIGESLEIEFPDGTLGTGIIKSILSSAYDSPDRKWEQYIPVTPHVRVHLNAENQQQITIWKSFDQMEVRIRGRK